jgi:hypothetical protein
MDFETIRKDDLISARALEREKQAEEDRWRDTVRHWLSLVEYEAEHLSHREKRRVCEDPGRWLLDTAEFKTWASHTDCLNSLLWLSGIPGSGMAAHPWLASGSELLIISSRQDGPRFDSDRRTIQDPRRNRSILLLQAWR